MRILLSRRAARDLDDLLPRLQSTVRKQLELLAANIRHPSLQSKKYDETNDIWQGRVNRSYRFYFQIAGDDYVILRIIPHPK
jgi:mRNA-degrading endonuclease RelE of RelBE toxin-antitoxin system